MDGWDLQLEWLSNSGMVYVLYKWDEILEVAIYSLLFFALDIRDDSFWK